MHREPYYRCLKLNAMEENHICIANKGRDKDIPFYKKPDKPIKHRNSLLEQ